MPHNINKTVFLLHILQKYDTKEFISKVVNNELIYFVILNNEYKITMSKNYNSNLKV